MAGASTYNALVIGAGPAGSAAAWAMARQGLRVALVDRQQFPRDKVCGDALIPDALSALDTMGVRAAVEAEATPLHELRVFAPNGSHVSLAGRFSCLPRQRFDAFLVKEAVGAGTELIEGMAVTGPRVEGGRVMGATFQESAAQGTTSRTITAPITLLATGANATVLSAFGLEMPGRPNAVAGRAYFRVPPDVAARIPYLCIAYERSLCPGYGWIFPGPDRTYNVGVGSFGVRGTPPRLRDVWTTFVTQFELAGAVVRDGEQLTEFRGAPMRTGLGGARLGVPGLLVLGEAAATTYPATGEGIGKAMESGLLAAQFVCEAAAGSGSITEVHVAYEAEFRRRFRARYAAYRVAEAWTSRPWLLNLLAWRARTGDFARKELEALVSETSDPRRLFSLKGLATAIVR